jgi:C1A family cysteine protease
MAGHQRDQMPAALPRQAWAILVIGLLVATLFLGISKARAESTSSADVTWTVKVNVVLPPAQVKSMGGQKAVNTLQNDLASKVQKRGATLSIAPQVRQDAGASFALSITGTGDLLQFKQVVFDDLNSVGGLLGGPISLRLVGNVNANEALPLVLESNLSTGYRWDVKQMDQGILKQVGDISYEPTSDLMGAPAKQLINVQAAEAAITHLTLIYHRPWEKDTQPTREVTLQATALSSLTDLSNPSKSLQRTDDSSQIAESPIVASLSGMPTKFDWRTTGKVTPVTDQGGCGACWAFGTVAVLESNILIRQNVCTDLSEQYLLSCNHDGWSCDGGWWAHNYHLDRYYPPETQAGAVLESDFPYTAKDDACGGPYSHPYKITNWAYVGNDHSVPSADAIKQAIYNYGPVAVSICAGPLLNNYTGGVFNTDESKSICNGGVNHAVTLVGWNDIERSWIAKNSWGTGWGENGYVRIVWGTSNVGYAATFVQNTDPLTHDDFSSVVTISSLPYAGNTDTSEATTAQDDPILPCVSGQKYNTVWYRYTPTDSGPLTVNTLGSDYDTVLGIWTGTRGALTSVGCNDDLGNTDNTRYSQVQLNVTKGQTYYIEVADYYLGGGQLILNVSMAAPAAPSTPAPANGLMLDRTSNINLSWTANATWCDVHVWGGSIDIDPSGNCASLQLAPQYGGSYQWQVTAHNAYGATSGPVWNFTVQPYAPTNLSTSAVLQSTGGVPTQTQVVPFIAQTQPYQTSTSPSTTVLFSAQSISDTLVNLTWTPSKDGPANVDSYKVYYSGGALIATLDASSSSYSASDLTCGTSYGFYVTVVRQGVESEPSNLAYATPACSPISVISVWTTSASGELKTDFNPGENISYWGYINNTTGVTQTAALTWTVEGPCGVLTPWGGNLNIANGATNWVLSRSISNTVCAGTYIYQLTLAYDGSSTSLSSAFTTYWRTMLPVIMK